MSEDSVRQLSFDFEQVPQQLLTPDEIFRFLDQENLKRWVEDSRFERKSSKIQPRALGEYFSMWSNTPPEGGVLVVGISNQNQVEGLVRTGVEHVNRLEQAVETFCPSAKYDIKRVPVVRDEDDEADFVLAYRVKYHETRVVPTADGRVYVRRGDSCCELKGEEAIRQLRADKGEISLETEPCGLRYPSDFLEEDIMRFAASVRAKKAWSAELTDVEILELLHLGKQRSREFIPNVACALLFAKSPRSVIPGCRIRFLRFEGVDEGVGDRWNATKDVFVDGTIPNMIQQAEAVLTSQLRTFSRLGTGGKFFTSPEYPPFAWYEAVVNATVHRSYGNGAKNMPIFVKMFEDRLVVESPGAFAPLVTPENIYDVHAPRNPFLMDAMFYLEYVKCAHEGTRRMRSEMLAMELPAPEFHQDTVGNAIVRATLRNGFRHRRVWVDSDVVGLLGAQIAHSLTEDQKRCINFCAEHGMISVSDAQRLTGKSWPAAKRMLMELVGRQVLEHVHRQDVAHDPQARFRLPSP